MPEIEYGHGEAEDLEAVCRLLEENGLPSQDVAQHISSFILARQDGAVVGAIGLEVRGADGLLRSLVVADGARRRGIGKALCTRLESEAHSKGVERLYLLTEGAEGFFAGLGFRLRRRTELPASIRQTEEFRCLCPESAVAMAKELSGVRAQFQSARVAAK